jgi:hypothetical protein
MRILKTIFILITGLLSALYLANIGAGIVEIIPDNLPGVGNLDEFIASLILLNSLAHFGLDLRKKPILKTHPPAIGS